MSGPFPATLCYQKSVDTCHHNSTIRLFLASSGMSHSSGVGLQPPWGGALREGVPRAYGAYRRQHLWIYR
ncbi:hypothetical protein WN48_01078 [Eufriesea mexicana]|nr:hypothetical protein WN48_01078 [Eufriesea mexicana]